MKNWSVNEEKLKQYPEEYTIWRLESLVNFGLDGVKLKESELRRYWRKLKIDPFKRRFLNSLLNV